MSKIFEFFRDAARESIDQHSIEFAVSKVTLILLELNIEEKEIIHLLGKHFDIKYSDSKYIINQLKEHQDK